MDYREFGKKRRELIKRIESELMNESSTLQKDLLESVWSAILGTITYRNGQVVNAAQAMQDVLRTDKFQKRFEDVVGKGMAKFMRSRLLEIQDLNREYFKAYERVLLPFTQVEKIVLSEMRRNFEAFMFNYNQSPIVASAIKDFATANIAQGKSIADMRTAFEDYFSDTPNRLGIVNNYNLYRTRIQDVFSEYDRKIGNQFATQFQLNYAVYQGGEIKTTRPFCEDRNNNVYTRDEIIAWQSEDWEGKKKSHNILIDCGGYNCRHYYDWISYELAKRLRPDIPKSNFDID